MDLFAFTDADVTDAIEDAVRMALAYQRQNLPPLEQARLDLAMGDPGSEEFRAVAAAAMEVVTDAVEVSVEVMLAAAGAVVPVA